MTQGPSDVRDGIGHGDGSFGRQKQRVSLLARASQAIHRAHTISEDGELVMAAEAEVRVASLELRALIEAEREGLKHLESAVRRFADALREGGTPPEVAVRRLKATVDPVVYSAREHDAADVEWRRAVAGDVMRWFVEAYYAA